jgi:hypothetical protein
MIRIGGGTFMIRAARSYPPLAVILLRRITPAPPWITTSQGLLLEAKIRLPYAVVVQQLLTLTAR